jgi:hypothetical protein
MFVWEDKACELKFYEAYAHPVTLANFTTIGTSGPVHALSKTPPRRYCAYRPVRQAG